MLTANPSARRKQKLIPAPTTLGPSISAPFRPAAGPGYTAAQVVNPHSPVVRQQLAAINPSGQSWLSYGMTPQGQAISDIAPMPQIPNSFDPQPTEQTGNPNPANQIDVQPFINDLYGQRDQALALRRNQDLASKKRLLLGFGSRELASSILGANDPFVQGIVEDPSTGTGWLAQRKYGLGQQTIGATNESSVANTFYGGGREYALGQLNRGFQQDLAGQTQSVKDQLTGVDTGYATFAQDWETRIADAKRQLALQLMGAV